MKQQWQNGITSFHFSTLSGDGQERHAIFTRMGGVSQGPFAALNLSRSVPDVTANVYANRSLAYGLHGRTSDSLVHAHLVHGAAVARVTRQEHGQVAPQVDALMTNDPGCGLTMNFADCAPVLLYDPANRAIGLGHAGWQGAVKDLPGALVRAMQAAFGSDPARLMAGIGPCIGPCCYEVGEPVISAVYDTFTQPEQLLLDKPVAAMPRPPASAATGTQAHGGNERPHFDLPAANRQRLQQVGVSHIELSGLCTACRTDLFFSHRAEQGRTGRFGAIFLLAAG